MKIALTTILPKEGFTRLAAHEMYAPIEDADILISTYDKPVTRDMIASAPHLRLITNFGVGYNNIDLNACRERGITVTNTPQPVIEPTAELCFSLMHAVARRTAELDRKMREGTTEPMGAMQNLGHGLWGKTLGIIGMGRIGQAVARRAEAAGMHIIYHNRKPLPQSVYGARYVSMEELLKASDFVSLNLPYTPDTHHLISSEQLRMMKKSAYLINTARGAHVDEAALVAALQKGEIAGAAMDVFEKEPVVSEKLKKMDNVVLSPHVGTGTWEGRIAMEENVTDNILYFLSGEREKMNIVM